MSGTLTVEQSKWLEGLVKPAGGGKGDIAKTSDTAGVRLKTRQQVLDGVLIEIGKIKGKLATTMQAYELIDSQGKSQKLLTGDLNPDEEIDTRHDVRGDSRIKDEKALLEIGKLVMVLNAQETTLRDAYANPDGTLADGKTGDALFTEDDIANEIWTPLVREGLFPENLVKRKHSEVAKLFAGAKQEYDRRLEAFSESGGSSNETADNLGLGAEIATSVGKFATGVLETFPEEIRGVSRDTVKKGVEIIAATGAFGLTVAQKALTLDAGTLLEAAEKGIKAAIGAAGLAEPTQKLLEKGFESAVHGGKFIYNVVQKKADDAIGSLADALAGGLETVGSYYEDDSYKTLAGRVKGSLKTLGAAKKVYGAIEQGGPELINAIGDLAKEAGDLVASEIKSSIETGDRLRKERELKQITDEFESKVKAAQLQIEKLTGACLSAAKVTDDIDNVVNSSQISLAVELSQQMAVKWRALLCSAAKGQDPGRIALEMDALLQEAAKKIKDLETLRGEIRKAASEAKARTEQVSPEQPQEEGDDDDDEGGDAEGGGDEEGRSDKEKEILAQLAQAKDDMTPEVALLVGTEAKARMEAMQKDAEEFSRLLGNDFAAAVNETDNSVQQARLAVSKLAPLIDKLKKDKAYLKLADTLANVSVAIGKAMFETLNPAGSFVTPAASFKECATNIYSAIGHMQELAKWEESMADSRNAGASALVASEFHRAGLEKKYRNADWVTAAIKAVETVGAALKATGIAAPMGATVVGGSKGAGEAVKLVTKFYKATELKKAWSDYEAALEDPEDRKKVRQALRSNPTLAKYALAWAALMARDPLARDAMRKIGLSDGVLADKDTDAHAVVDYMETMFDQDPVVLRATPNRHDWWPGKPVLTARNWMMFVKAAEETDESFQGADAIIVTQLLVQMEKLMPAALASPIDDEAVKKARAVLDELIDYLATYDPLDGEGNPCDGMRDYAEVIQAQAELKRRSLPATQEVTV